MAKARYTISSTSRIAKLVMIVANVTTLPTNNITPLTNVADSSTAVDQIATVKTEFAVANPTTLGPTQTLATLKSGAGELDDRGLNRIDGKSR